MASSAPGNTDPARPRGVHGVASTGACSSPAGRGQRGGPSPTAMLISRLRLCRSLLLSGSGGHGASAPGPTASGHGAEGSHGQAVRAAPVLPGVPGAPLGLARELFECGVYPLSDILGGLGLGQWECAEEFGREGGVSSMAESQAEDQEAADGSAPVLSANEDRPTMGTEDDLIAWVDNVYEMMRTALQDRIKSSLPPDNKVRIDAENTFYRCLDQLAGFCKRYDRKR